MSDLIQVRRGTSAEWAAANPVLAEAEPGYDKTTGDYKFGDGVTAWLALSSRYVPLTGGVLIVDTTTSGIATASVTDIAWGAEVSDPDGWHAAASATLIVPAGKAGRYIVTYSGRWSAAPGTTPGVGCLINTVGTYENSMGSAPTYTYWVPTLTFVRTFAVADTIKFSAYQNSGSARDLVSRLEIAPI